MKFKVQKLTEEQAKEVSTWKYEGEYKIYNLPKWNDMVKDNYSLCDELKRERFTAYINEKNELIGFTNLLDEGNSVFFGIGINPKYCNKGIGKKITKLSLDECKVKFPNKPVILEVRTWNTRAINCYKSQGFEVIETKHQETCIGLGEFYVMKHLNIMN